MTDVEREKRRYKKALIELVDAISCALVSVDQSMQGPSSPERGKKIGMAMTFLAYHRDSAAHFGLGQSFDVVKRNAAKAVQAYKKQQAGR